MADMETHAEIAEDPFKASNKTTTLNGHPDSPTEDCDKESICSDKVENGQSECKSPQLNGDIGDKSDLDVDCSLPNADNICVDEKVSETISNEGADPENGKPSSKSDYLPDSEIRSYDNLSDVSISNNESIVSEEQVDKSYLCTKGNDPEENKSSKDISDGSKDTSDNESALVDSHNNLIEPSIGKEAKDKSGDTKEVRNDKSDLVEGDKSGNLGKECDDISEDLDEKRDLDDENDDQSGDKGEERDKVGDDDSGVTSESVKDENEPKDLDSDSQVTQDTRATPSEKKDVKGDKIDGKEKGKKKDDMKPLIVKRVTRSSSGVSKPIKYTDPDPRSISDDDDDIKITKEVKKDEESDIEMIEESDPLAISDADVKKAKEATKTTVPPVQERLKNFKPKETTAKAKDESNVIIIDTNTLLKGQNTITPVPPAKPAGSVSTSAQTTGCGNTASNNIQTAIQAITGGNPAIQGLQSAYLNAIQQVLVAQGGSQVSNPHYIATLQQYYNTLGALQDDAYVIEAPSFIVPYVMEGKPIECIKDYLVKINKELEELEKKKREEEAEALKKKEAEEAASANKENNEETEGMEDKDDESKQLEKKSEEGKSGDEETSEDNKSPSQEESAKEEKAKSPLPSGEGSTESVTTPARDDDDKENKKEPSKTKEEEEDIIQLDGDFEKPKEDFSHLGRWEGYYRSALGRFFVELGLNHVQEFIQSDLLRMQKRRVEKKTSPTKQDIYSLKMLERQVSFSKQKNAHLYMPMKTCRFCSFKTESGLVMERHLESPHMVNYTYKCNFCDFETRGPQVILFHTEAEHNVRGRLERAPAFFQCPLCPFEDNNKSKMTRHSFSCTKKFKADKNSDLPDWEPPAKIPKIHRGRPNTFGKTFDALKMPNLLPKSLGGLSLNLHNAISSGLLGPTGPAASPSINSVAGRGRGRPVGSYKNITQPIGGRSGSVMYPNRGANLLQPLQGVSSAQLSIANQVLQSMTQGAASRVPRILPAASAGSLIPGLAASSSITIQSVQSKSGASKSPQQPSISITPLPRGGSSQSGSKTTPTNVSNNSQRPAFVICEICDGYIKDLEQLRNHMNLIHKVKIHPKMIYNRPPLNCQKCQHRFFTDQGLERHLLGTHGLVTSSMQEAANKGKDAGRCPICGKVFQWKLLNHVSRDHKMTLKPAHLSYKCTVCTATFNMYRLFENHVYSAHSVVNKNKGNEASSNASSVPAKKSAPGTETPLKINDEITIIPQPASKSPKSESKVSPKKTESPSMSKEITITKVGSRSSSRRTGSSVGIGNSNNGGTNGTGGAGGVEVISLDDSPHKRQAASSSSDEPPPKKRTRDTATSKRARTST